MYLQSDGVYLLKTWTNTIYSLKYQMATTSGCKDIGIKQLKLVAKTDFLLKVTIKH